MLSQNNEFKILSIDGGGIRGIVPAHIVHCLSNKLNIDILDNFKMIAGTSTGSIIAAGLVCRVDTSEIVDLYKTIGEKVFVAQKSLCPGKFKPAFHSLYDNSYLQKTLKEIFGNKTLGDINHPLIIPSTDVGNGGVHVFKSSYSKDFTRDKSVLLRDAVLASCSAPTFFDPTKVDVYSLADGGLWANNPSLTAFVDAQKRLNVDPSVIKILSLGTGHEKTFYGTNTDKKWGLVTGWGAKQFINFILSLQSQSTQNYLKLLMDDQNLLRVNFESDKPLPLDDVSAVGDLLSKADLLFTHNTEKIKKLLNIL